MRLSLYDSHQWLSTLVQLEVFRCKSKHLLWLLGGVVSVVGQLTSA
jgi:hypothetical protein